MMGKIMVWASWAAPLRFNFYAFIVQSRGLGGTKAQLSSFVPIPPRMRDLVMSCLITLLLALAGPSCHAGPTDRERSEATSRPEHWAQRHELEGIPNLFKVSDQLYRSGQPTRGGMRELKKLGVQTIVNLRSFHSDRDEIGDTGLAYEHIYMKAWHPEQKEVVRFLQIVANSKRTPVLVHCNIGADRTGVMCAVYRIIVQGWTKDEAIDEMTAGGFGFCPAWQNLVTWVRQLDVEAIRQRAGLTSARH